MGKVIPALPHSGLYGLAFDPFSVCCVVRGVELPDRGDGELLIFPLEPVRKLLHVIGVVISDPLR